MKNARVQLEDNVRNALLTNEPIAKAEAQWHKECADSSNPNPEKPCTRAGDKLSLAIADFISNGG